MTTINRTRRDENKTIKIVNTNPLVWQHGLSMVGFFVDRGKDRKDETVKHFGSGGDVGGTGHGGHVWVGGQSVHD